MNIKTYTDLLLKKRSASEMVATAKSLVRPVASENELKSAIEDLKGFFEKNDHKQGVATGIALAMADADNAIARLRRKGYLRASRYGYDAKCLIKVVRVMRELCEVCLDRQVRPDRLAYLDSVLAIYSLAQELRTLEKSIVLRLQAYKTSALKTLLVSINQAFLHPRPIETAVHEYFTPEVMAEAYSTLLRICTQKVGLPSNWNYVDEKSLTSMRGFYGDLLKDAARVNEHRDAEILIDGLPYKAQIEGKKVIVSSIDPDFEKSVRLGYIQTNQQLSIRAMELFKEKMEGRVPQALSEFIASAFNAGFGDLIQPVSAPIKRLVFNIPPDEQFFEPVSGPHYFYEEVSALYSLSIENFGTDEISSIELGDKISVWDVLRFQRLFAFISYAYAEKLKLIEEGDRDLMTLRSVVILFHEKLLLHILSIAIPEANAEGMLRLLTLNLSDDHFDLQYTPLIKNGDYYIVAPALVARSNLIRNIARANNLARKFPEGIDPMQKSVADALETAGFKVNIEVKGNKSGKRETDILAWRDNCLFVFECKNAYHPCSPHEMRNSFDYIKKGEDQLNIRVAWMKNKNNQESLFRKINWDMEATSNIYSCIVTSNRLFNGYINGAHPVRQARELINVLLRGEVKNLTSDQVWKFWKSDRFSTEDLVDYLRGESIIYPQLETLKFYQREFDIGLRRLIFDSYYMDIMEVKNKIESNFSNI